MLYINIIYIHKCYGVTLKDKHCSGTVIIRTEPLPSKPEWDYLNYKQADYNRLRTVNRVNSFSAKTNKTRISTTMKQYNVPRY